VFGWHEGRTAVLGLLINDGRDGRLEWTPTTCCVSPFLWLSVRDSRSIYWVSRKFVITTYVLACLKLKDCRRVCFDFFSMVRQMLQFHIRQVEPWTVYTTLCLPFDQSMDCSCTHQCFMTISAAENVCMSTHPASWWTCSCQMMLLLTKTIRLILTIQFTTCAANRSFSGLRRLKTYPRETIVASAVEQ